MGECINGVCVPILDGDGYNPNSPPSECNIEAEQLCDRGLECDPQYDWCMVPPGHVYVGPGVVPLVPAVDATEHSICKVSIFNLSVAEDP